MNVYKMSLLFFFGFIASVNCLSDGPNSIYDITINDNNHNAVPLSQYRGRAMLIINYARLCGFNKLYLDSLEKLADNFKDCNFRVLMIPSNSFLQNPNWNEEYGKNLTQKNFDVFEEVSVIGSNTHPLYVYLTNQIKGLLFKGIKWNFTKFLVDPNGKVIERYSPFTSTDAIGKRLEGILKCNGNKP
ncbi:uncharacterized protein LOC126846387 [Adelges cooleyi]|uniref:uncharacterized protein LOC126846387 n=1 Tax=Adelges cooleyi TaxID=133065 RepID=UPI00217FC710|nr:uncharacterized protein LOC126846387 [Adelges cooleyi]